MLICELLADPSFSSFKLLAGASGVQNCISTVTVVDTPDGAKWLNGGEFVITTGFMLGDDEGSLLEFLRLLCEKGVAGLGIKQNRYTTLIPESARMLADDQGLPLISIPESYAFVDIINPVLTRIIDRQAFQLSQTNLIHNKFLDLAVNDRPVFEILQELSLILGIPSSFIDTYFKKIYHSDTSSNFAKQVDEVEPGRITLKLLSGYDYYKVAKQNQTFGYMLFPKGKLNQEVGSISRVAVEQAAIVLILRMQVRVSNKYVEDRYKNVFLEDLLLNNIKSESEIHNRALLYGWDFHSGGLVAVVDINNIKKHFAQQLDADKSAMLDQVADTIFEVSCREMLREFPDAKCMRQSDLFTYVLSAGGAQLDALDDRLRQVFSSIQTQLVGISSFTITLGVGSYCHNIRDICKSYTEARAAINLGYILHWYDRILFYHEMGLYRMLLPLLGSAESREYCEQYITKLETYDAENGTDLFNTLNEIVQTGWNLKKASENMYLHYNSMKYRFSRICTIMELDLNDHANRVTVSIALIVHAMNRNQLPDMKKFDLT